MTRPPRDRYGRTLARVAVGGADLGEALIAAGLARRWDGRRRPWCP
jgi:micrococcal nuclease